MKIYTRGGDKGETGLLGGERVRKDSLRIQAYGTLDELNSHLGLLRDHAQGRIDKLIVPIQEKLFTLGSRLASGSEAEADRFKVPRIADEDIDAMEAAMDEMDKELPEMRSFILPGGHIGASQAHVCRTVCRRAERLAVELGREEEVSPITVRFLNRLSDLLFMLARHLAYRDGVADTPWRPKA